MTNIPQYTMPVPLFRYRVMFSDGECIDVVAPRDSSTMRDFALEMYYRQSKVGAPPLIVGVADLGKFDDEEVEVPPE